MNEPAGFKCGCGEWATKTWSDRLKEFQAVCPACGANFGVLNESTGEYSAKLKPQGGCYNKKRVDAPQP